MLGAIAGDIIGSVYEGWSLKATDFPLFDLGSTFTDDSVLNVWLTLGGLSRSHVTGCRPMTPNLPAASQ